MRNLTIFILLYLSAFAFACGNNEDNNINNNGLAPDVTPDVSGSDESSDTKDETSGVPDETEDPDEAPDEQPQPDETEDEASDEVADEEVDEVSVEGGVLVGTVKRTSDVNPADPDGDGVGSVYIAVFTENPISGFGPNPNAMLVAVGILEGADLSDEATRLSYRIEGIPVRPEPYHISAFQDDNGNVDPQMPDSAQPDTSDPIDATFMMFMLSFPTVVIDSTDEKTLDLDLKFKRPV